MRCHGFAQGNRSGARLFHVAASGAADNPHREVAHGRSRAVDAVATVLQTDQGVLLRVHVQGKVCQTYRLFYPLEYMVRTRKRILRRTRRTKRGLVGGLFRRNLYDFLTRTDNRVKDPEKRKSERKKCLGIVGNDVEFKGDVDDWYHEYKRKPENAKKEHNAVVCGSAEKNEDYHITRRFRPLDSEGGRTTHAANNPRA